MALESGLDLMLVLLYAKGLTGKQAEEIRNTTRLVKEIFLLVKEGGFKQFEGDFDFRAYDFGPWSKEIFDGINALKELGLLRIGKVVPESYEEIADEVESVVQSENPTETEEEKQASVYSLTKDGLELAEELYNELSVHERNKLEEIKKKFNKMDQQELLKYVYKKYQELTIKSKIKDKVIPESMHGNGANMPVEEDKKEAWND